MLGVMPVSEALADCGLGYNLVKTGDVGAPRYNGGYKLHSLAILLNRNQARFLNDTLTEWLARYSYPQLPYVHRLFASIQHHFFNAIYSPFDLHADCLDPIEANECREIEDDSAVVQIVVQLTPGDAMLMAQWITLRYAVDAAPPAWYTQPGHGPQIKLLLDISHKLLDIVGLAPLGDAKDQTACRIDMGHECPALMLGRGRGLAECEALSFESNAKDLANRAMGALQALSPNGDMAASYVLSYLRSHHARAWTLQMQRLLGGREPGRPRVQVIGTAATASTSTERVHSRRLFSVRD